MTDIDSTTRRRILKVAAGTLGVAATAGAASGHVHPDDGGADDHDVHRHDSVSGTVEQVGYHSLGDVGPASDSGSSDEPHYGGISELRVQGDYAYVAVFSSRDPTNDRGLAVLDVSDFTTASDEGDLQNAELEVVAFLRNGNPAVSVMDVKLSNDGQYAFVCKQNIAALFGEEGPTPGPDGSGTSPNAGSLQAVDVSDPANPQVVGSWDAWAVGPHNCYHHQIDGTDCLFACKGALYTTSALYVFEFDRATGSIRPVNYYTVDGDLRQGEAGSEQTEAYSHDITVQDDPRTGTTTGYWSNWENGVRVLDLSTPTDIEEVGWFDMGAPDDETARKAHYAQPAPTLVDGKRVFVAGQEVPSRPEPGDSGRYFLVDADPVYTDDPGTSLDALDSWAWTDKGNTPDTVTFGNFTLSPHNVDITEDGWVTAGHYHLGVRFLKISSAAPSADGTAWKLLEKGHYASHEEVPDESKANGVSSALPFFWTAVEENGVVFGSGISSGVYALTIEPMTVGDGEGGATGRNGDSSEQELVDAHGESTPDAPDTTGDDTPVEPGRSDDGDGPDDGATSGRDVLPGHSFTR